MTPSTSSGERNRDTRRPGHPRLRLVATAALAVVALALVLVLGALVFLATPAGGERLRRLLVEKADATIQGTLAVQEVSLRAGHLIVRGVELRDPDGDLVASIDELELRLRLAELVRKRVDLSQVRLERPEIYIDQDSTGSNLQRAVAQRSPSPQREQSQGSTLAMMVEDLEIAGGEIDVVRRSEAAHHLHLDDLVAHGSAEVAGDVLAARLEITAGLAAPFEGPFHLKVDARGAGARRDARVVFQLGRARLVASAHAEGESHIDARIESLALAPEVARAFLPSYPLRAVADLSADARRRGDEVSLHLDARAASARARVDGDVDLRTRRLRGTKVTVRHVDLSELTEGGPPSDVTLNVVASGGGTTLRDLAGRLELTIPASRMGGETMGPVHVLATAGGGEVRLPELLIAVPGLRVEARGRASEERLALRGELVATELAALSRTLGKLAGARGLAVKGQGRLGVALAGSVRHPSLKADGGFPVLAFRGLRIEGLTLGLSAPDLSIPTGVKAHARANVLAVSPGKVFRPAKLEVDGAGRELTLDAAVHGYADLVLQARATLSRDGRSATLSALSLRYPKARWGLDAPVRIESRLGLLAVSPLTLRSGAQALSLRALRRGARLDAAADVRSLDLGRLPKALVDPALALGGILDVQIRAKGPSSRPDVAAKIHLQGGCLRRYRNIGLHLDASYARDEVTGKLAASGDGVKLASTFAVPVKALAQGRRAPVRAEVDIAEVRLDESLRDLGLATPISGLYSARASLSGTADDPRLEVRLQGRRLQLRDLAPSEVDLALQSGDDGRLRARADLVVEGRKSYVEVRTPFTLGRLLRRPPTRASLESADIAIDADVRQVPLKLLSQAGWSSRRLAGTLTARAHLTGTARAPRGELSLSGTGLAVPGLEPIDVRTRVQAGDGLRAEAEAEQGGRRVFAARGSLGAAPEQLARPARLRRAEISLTAHIGPLSLSQVQATTQPADMDPAQAPPRMRGTMTGSLTVSGTLRDPRLSLQTRVDGLGAGSSPDGRVVLRFDYRDARETLELLMRSRNGGELRAAGRSQVDLSYPAVTRARRTEATPLDATLRAKDFDPAFLSNLSGAVEKVGGLLYADARLSGSTRSPEVKGRIEWKGGVLFTHGSGDFRDIHLLATGDNDRIELKELAAKSGQGTAKLSAVATRTGRQAFKLHAAAEADKLPVMSQGQLAATVSIRSTAEGAASPSRVLIKSLHIPEAHVQLPDVHRKDVQKLEDPPDVVLTVRGKPVHGAKAPTQVSAAAETGGAGPAGVGAPAGSRPPMQVTIVVDAPRNLWIQGKDVNTEVGLSRGFRVEYAAQPRMFGDVNVIRGRLDVFGRRFDLQRDSKVSFTGPPMKPALNVTADYKNEIEQVTVQLKVQGQPGKLTLQPTSDPPLPETEIYTLLATGHTSLRHGTGKSSPSDQAASLVGSVAASELKKTLSSKLPLDVLSIEAGDSGIAGSKLEAGTYVNDRLYLGFTGRLGADPMRGENSNEVDLEYQLSKHWSLEGSYGDARAGGAGVTWRTEY